MKDDKNTLKNEIIKELCNLNIQSDIEALADFIVNKIKNISGKEYVKAFGMCPICVDCPKNCPLDK